MEHEPKQASRLNSYMTPISIVIAGALIGGAIILSKTIEPAAVPVASPQAQAPIPQIVDQSKITTTSEPFLGNPNAPVTIDYWFDYQCPFCKQNEETAMPELIKNYVSTGKAKIVFKDYEFLGPDSQTIGLFARAVWDTAPNKFYEWHKAIYDNQGRENTGWATQAEIVSITKTVLGTADTARVVALEKSNTAAYQAEMDRDKTEGTSIGISGTPGFVIGNQLVVGAQPYSSIKSAVDQALKMATK